MLTIANHKITTAKYVPMQIGKDIKPIAIVVHFTGGGSTESALSTWRGTPIAAHVVVEKDGSITQCVPFNKRANHAGASSLHGRDGCNNFTIGIEIVNWGNLTKRGDGSFASWASKNVAADCVILAAHKLINPDGTHNPNQPWEAYTPAQIEAVSAIISALGQTYPSIKEVVGHEDVAPYRKSDPGPAAPMSKWKAALNPNARASVSKDIWKVKSKDGLNVRSKPLADSDKIGELANGANVSVVGREGVWYMIQTESIQGWVNSAYLVDI